MASIGWIFGEAMGEKSRAIRTWHAAVPGLALRPLVAVYPGTTLPRNHTRPSARQHVPAQPSGLRYRMRKTKYRSSVMLRSTIPMTFPNSSGIRIG